jgi:hypothetical protein
MQKILSERLRFLLQISESKRIHSLLNEFLVLFLVLINTVNFFTFYAFQRFSLNLRLRA